MPILVELEDGRTLEFPDGTDPKDIKAYVDSKYPISAKQEEKMGVSFQDALQGMRNLKGAAPLVGALAGGAVAGIPGGVAGYYGGKQIDRALETGNVGTPGQQVTDIGEGAVQELGGQLVGKAASSVLNKVKPYAYKLYESALKPSTTLKPEVITQRVNTALEHGIPVSEKGLQKSRSTIKEINNKIKETIDNATGVTIGRDRALQPVGELSSKMQATKIDANSDLIEIAKYVDDIQSAHPEQIAIQQAQKFKQTLNKELDEYYAAFQRGKVTPPGVIQKTKAAMADGLRSEISTLYPQIQTLNAKEASLIQLNKSLTRAVNRIHNREIIPLLAGIAAGTATTHGILKALALKAIDHPEVKSKLAIVLYRANAASMGKAAKATTQMGLTYYNSILKDQETK